ncbi:MAG TPA: hypothetical protein VFE10_00830, partial [Phenylobacterium sp.]|nr:hypothetical protein [Phenylobacterium sp.]
NRFTNQAQRDAFILAFIRDYNRTRLRCLNHKAPEELLANLPGHNTQAGIQIQSRTSADLIRIPGSAGMSGF